MSVKSLGEPIAGTGNLYAWGGSQILKLYGPDVPDGWVEHMGRMDRALYEAGLPVPAVGEIIEIDGGLGQIYERIEGGPMAEELLGIPESDSARVVQLAHVFAEVHAKIHAYNDIQADVPFQRQFFPNLIRRIDVLPDDLKDATLKAFDEMPEGDRLCHGDYHPFNVLMSPRGPFIIDWNNSHIGNPLEDVARSSLILTGFSFMSPSNSQIIDRFNQVYLERYFQLHPDDQEQLVAWRPIVAAVRLLDNIPEIQDWLLEQIRIGLAL